LRELVRAEGLGKTLQAMRAYQRYEEKITGRAFRMIPRGLFRFRDYLEDDGMGHVDIPIEVAIRIAPNEITVDFRKSSDQVEGPLNATLAITYSSVAYVFRCLVLALTGEDCLSLKNIKLLTRPGSIVDARYPSAVAGGNVETSQRLVDVLLGALAQACPHLIPAASQGTMNNLAIGNEGFSYYETLGGGTGGGPWGPGISAIHSHMTNTLNTPIEAIENDIPLRITSYKIRRSSAGAGRYPGGDGLIRGYEFLEKTHLSLLTERRRLRPYGFKGGRAGKPGLNCLKIPTLPSSQVQLPGKFEWTAQAGTELVIATPGGGGFGKLKKRKKS